MTQQLQLDRTAAVCVEAELLGAVAIGARSAVHPGARIRAIDGRIVLGARCFVEDGAVLASAGPDGLEIGSDNIFESGCDVRARRVGSGNVFEAKAQARAGSVVGSNCVIGSGVVIAEDERVADNSVLVAVRGPSGQVQRVKRTQKDFMAKAHTALVQKYADIFPRGAKSPYALEKHHQLRQ